MNEHDRDQILKIYELGLKTKNATFETEVPTWLDWDSGHHRHSRFVCVYDNRIVGWTALSPVSTRKVYSGVAELSIYVDTSLLRNGIGSLLMAKVIESSENNGIWTLFSSVFPENKATLRLHERFDFRVIGTREKIAQLDGIWRDTIIMERRSLVVG